MSYDNLVNAWVWDEDTITAYGTPLAPVTLFNYIGRFLLAAEEE